MQYTSLLLTGASLLATVSAHGFITDPKPRLAGEAMKATCGTQVYYNQASDTYGNIQGELQVASNQADYNAEACNIWLCKGFKFEDNPAANIQSYTAGQVVPISFDLRAPHAGVANVSIVDTSTNTIIGSPLLSYSDFANNAYPTPANQTSFSITIPSNLGAKCAVAGACVIQHWWDARSIDQSYQSCIDFTVAGSGVGSPAPVSSSSSAAVVSTTSATASSTAAPAPVVTSITSAVPTTLQTVTRPASTSAASTSAAAPSATAAPIPEEEEDCEEL